MGGSRLKAGLIASGAALLMLTVPGSAVATTINVNQIVDNKTNDQTCSLREAVDAANTNAVVNPGGGADCPAGSPSDVDVIQLSAVTYNLAGADNDDSNATGDLDLSSTGGPVRLQGAGPTNAQSILDVNSNDRLLHLTGNANVHIDKVTIRDGEINGGGQGGGIVSNILPPGTLTITGSRIQDNEVLGAAGGMSGGGLAVTTGSVVIDDSSFFNNLVENTDTDGGLNGYAVAGGGIALTGAVTGTSTITDSDIESNNVEAPVTANGDPFPEGGGIAHIDSPNATLVIARTTIRDNDLVGGEGRTGGGLAFAHNTQSGANLRIDNSTFSGNTVQSTGLAFGGGLYTNGGNADVSFTSFTDNNAAAALGEAIHFSDGLAPKGTFDLRNSVMDESGTNECFSAGVDINSLGGNVERGTAPGECDLDGPNDHVSSGEKLATLLDNGGPYIGFPTILPLAGSPAIDRIPLASCLDSAGAPSPADQRGFGRVGNCDAGSGEFGSTGPPPPPVDLPVTGPPPGTTPVTQPGTAPGKNCAKKKGKKGKKGAKKRKGCGKKKRKKKK